MLKNLRYRYRAFIIAMHIQAYGYEAAMRMGRRRGWIARTDKDWGVHLAP